MSNKSESLTYNFILPLFGKPHSFYSPYLKGAFIADATMRDYNTEGNIFLLIERKNDYEKLMVSLRGFETYLTEYDINDFEVMVVLRLSDNFKPDYFKFIDGKYSRMSDEAKALILATSKPKGNNYKILTRDSGFREWWEKKLDVELTPEDEVYWKPEIEKESYLGVGKRETSS